MKHVDYLYFNIYNYFYRLSHHRSVINPRMQAMYLFSLGSGGWLLLLESLYLHLVKHSRFEQQARGYRGRPFGCEQMVRPSPMIVEPRRRGRADRRRAGAHVFFRERESELVSLRGLPRQARSRRLVS